MPCARRSGKSLMKDKAHQRSPDRDGVDAYHKGDYAVALEMLDGPARRGNALAQVILGLMYYDGAGVSQNHAVAARWLQLAIDFGDRSGIAEAMLGNIEAAARARSRAERGDASSMRSLAFGYACGFGLPRSPELAYFWLRLAILNGCEQSSSLLATAKAKLSAEQVEEADRAAMQWRPEICH